MKRLIPWAVVIALSSSLSKADEGAREATRNTSGTSAVTDELSTGWKIVVCTVATHYRTGNTSATAAITTDLSIPANTPRQLYINRSDKYIAFILDSSTGVCNIYRQTPGPTGVPPMIAAAHSVTDAAVVALDGGGTATATVTAGTICVCSIAATYTSASCTLSGTTLSITGSDPGRNVSYICST